ncbi:sugar phosphate isomerase/epimerase [Pseudovibrio exalbescens]|uniref:sugar phosphate isomerase/epimerase family protein n=1 Tax=Pseudovibrio exalbescens TaxID=197461 RepID=UPI0023663A8E|nr:sugar phosphate isomerase/epimerase family protein [Pseudovibrio exalbescens]MDD7910311.1 sugar phosphate isomerase/epimerase [Pseudovibrio exalbescens]
MGGYLPIVGAAMSIAEFDEHREWMLEKQRPLELQDFVPGDVLNGNWEHLADEVLAKLEGFDGPLGIHGPFWNLDISAADPDIRKVVQKRLDQGLEVCRKIKATHMVVHSPYTNWDHHNLDQYDQGHAFKLECIHENLRAAVAKAEDIGCTLMIENIEDVDPNVRVDLVKSFNSDAVAVSLDTGHAYYAHGSTGAPPVDYYVKAAGALLKHVHLQDADGYADRHWAMGEGTLKWEPLFRAFQKYTNHPRLIIELANNKELPKAAQYLLDQRLAQ